jgi:PAS domain S-box-containing protein
VLRRTSPTEELLRRISFHEGILKNPSLAVFAADQKGKVVLWSKGAEAISGIPEGKIRGRKLPPVLRETATEMGQDVPTKELRSALSRLAKRIGCPPMREARQLVTTISRVTDDAEVFLGTIGVALDVTRTVIAQRRLEELGRIIEGLGDAVVQIDVNGRVTYWNSGATKISGYSRKEALGMEGPFFVKWKTPTEYSEMLKAVRDRGSWRDEVTGIKKDGSEYKALVSISGLYSSRGVHIGSMIVGTDVTQLREAETRIAEQARLLDRTREAIAQTNAEGKVVFWNKGAEMLTGYTAKEALGKGRAFFEKIAPSYDREKMLAAFKKKEVFTRELELVRKTGEHVLALVSHTPLHSSGGTYLGAIAVVTDITQLKETQKKVEEQARLIDRAQDAIIRSDSKGTLTFWNRGAELLTGYRKKEVMGKPWTFFKKIWPDLDSESILKLALKRKVYRGEMTGIRKDGKEFIALVSMTPLFEPSGEYSGMLGIATNVTRLRRAERRAVESQKLLQTILDSIDDLVAVVDQDMNLVFSNKAIKRYTGFTEKDFRAVGGPYYMMPDVDKSKIDGTARQLRRTRGPYTVELSIPTKSGESRRAEWRAIRVDEDEPGRFKVVTVGRDMTERIRVEEESRLLLELNSALTSSLDLEEIAPIALEKTIEILGADAGVVAITEAGGRTMRVIADSGMRPDMAARLRERRTDEGWTGSAIRSGEPIIIEDIRKSRYKNGVYPETVRGGYLSFLSFPLKVREQVYGVFEIAARHSGRFKKSDLGFITSVATVLSSTLHNAILHSELMIKQKELTELAEKLATVEEDERRMIAADLHDETGQLLAAAKANMQMATRRLTGSGPDILSMVEETTDLIAKALDQVRDISHGLHPALLDDVGFPAAVKWLAQKTREATGTKIRVRTKGTEKRMPAPVEASLFRIVQEILTNIARHANADSVRIDLLREATRIRIRIEDDGVGFDLEGERKSPRGLGLRTLSQRVRWLGGEIKLQSARGKGTLVEVEIPTEAYENEEH